MTAVRRGKFWQTRAASASRPGRPQPRRAAAAVARVPAARPAGRAFLPRGALLGFLREAAAELKKVTWPTRQQAQNLTLVVIGVSFAVGLILGGMDYVFEKLVEVLLRVR